jgi:hypothetical protein
MRSWRWWALAFGIPLKRVQRKLSPSEEIYSMMSAWRIRSICSSALDFAPLTFDLKRSTHLIWKPRIMILSNCQVTRAVNAFTFLISTDSSQRKPHETCSAVDPRSVLNKVLALWKDWIFHKLRTFYAYCQLCFFHGYLLHFIFFQVNYIWMNYFTSLQPWRSAQGHYVTDLSVNFISLEEYLIWLFHRQTLPSSKILKPPSTSKTLIVSSFNYYCQPLASSTSWIRKYLQQIPNWTLAVCLPSTACWLHPLTA